MKKCTTCETFKEEIEFSKNKTTKNGLQNVCRSCKSAYHSGLKKENKNAKLLVEGKKCCARCKEIKTLDYFFNNKTTTDGLTSYCKSCQVIKNREQYQKTRKIYTCETCGAVVARPGFCEPCRKVYIREKRAADERKKRDSLEYKLKNNISRAIRGALFTKGLDKKGWAVLNYLPYTMTELITHIEAQFEPWMNWKNHGNINKHTWKDNDPATWTWHIDHIIPHNNFHYTSMEDEAFRQCWALSNLRPLNAKQNIKDGARKR